MLCRGQRFQFSSPNSKKRWRNKSFRKHCPFFGWASSCRLELLHLFFSCFLVYTPSIYIPRKSYEYGLKRKAQQVLQYPAYPKYCTSSSTSKLIYVPSPPTSLVIPPLPPWRKIFRLSEAVQEIILPYDPSICCQYYYPGVITPLTSLQIMK